MTSHHLKADVHGDRETPAAQHSLSFGPLPRIPLVASHAPAAVEATPPQGGVFLCSLWLSVSLSPLPEHDKVQTNTVTLGGYPNYASRVLPKLRAVWASEAAKTLLHYINRER